MTWRTESSGNRKAGVGHRGGSPVVDVCQGKKFNEKGGEEGSFKGTRNACWAVAMKPQNN